MIARYSFVIALFALAEVFASCETVVDSSGLPYEDQIIVRGMIQDGQPIAGISFSRTTPLRDSFVTLNAALSDVSANITVDGKQYSLQYRDSGIYICPQLIPTAGKTYSLDADWHGKHVHGETTIPLPPVIDSVNISKASIDTALNSDPSDTTHSYFINSSLHAFLESAPGAVYSINYLWPNPQRSGDTDWIAQVQYDRYSQNLRLDTSSKPRRWRVSIAISDWVLDSISSPMQYYAVVYRYDPKYYDFLSSYNRTGDNSGGIFDAGGLNPDWNVTGDGFGIFFGISASKRPFTF